MLAWFDEPAELLAQAVTSAAVVADRVVAVDGGYRLRPGARGQSPKDQRDAISEAACECGIQAQSYIPRDVWDGQVEKRNFMLDWACESADWVIPLDADWVFKGDPDAVRAEIAAATVPVLRVPMFTPYDGSRPLEQVASTSWHEQLAGEWLDIDILVRVMPGLRVEKSHWGYSGEWNGERVNLWGCIGVYPDAPRERSGTLMVEHRCFDRDLGRIEANRAYCLARDAEALETGAES
jgi:hypothetical protein